MNQLCPKRLIGRVINRVDKIGSASERVRLYIHIWALMQLQLKISVSRTGHRHAYSQRHLLLFPSLPPTIGCMTLLVEVELSDSKLYIDHRIAAPKKMREENLLIFYKK